MCVVSMVHDHFAPKIPTDWQPPYIPNWTPVDEVTTTKGHWSALALVDAAAIDALRQEIAGLRQLIVSFREAVEAARKVDALTAQPDCVDPEKAKLEERVSKLEQRLDAIGEALGG